MHKIIIGIALMSVSSTGASAQVTQTPEEARQISTRFGSLTVNENKTLLFNGRPLTPSVDGNNSLDLGELFLMADDDVVLVIDNGGTACPVMYYLITVNEKGAKATPAFGTCGELSRVKRTGGTLSLFMPGFRGPFESNKARLKAAKETHIFTFREGVLLKDGKPVK